MKWEIVALTIGHRYLGEVEAETQEEAKELGEQLPGAEAKDVTEVYSEWIFEDESLHMENLRVWPWQMTEFIRGADDYTFCDLNGNAIIPPHNTNVGNWLEDIDKHSRTGIRFFDIT